MSIGDSIRQSIARREQRRREAEKNGWQFPSPYDAYLCRDTEFRKYHRIWRVHKLNRMQTSRHIADIICQESAVPLIPVVPPKPKCWLGRFVDWARRVVK